MQTHQRPHCCEEVEQSLIDNQLTHKIEIDVNVESEF